MLAKITPQRGTKNVWYWYILLIFIYLLCFSYSILNNNIKYKVGLLLFFLITPILFYISNINKIALCILAINFPITLQLFGKDAISTGTVFIIIIYILIKLNKDNVNYDLYPKDNLLLVVFIIILISVLGTTLNISGSNWGPNIRHLVNFISSVVLFFIIISPINKNELNINELEYIEKIIGIIIIVVTLQICVSFLVFFFPNYQNLFSIFFHRTQNNFNIYFSEAGNIYRSASVIMEGEQFGELLAILFPFVLYKALKKKKFYI